MRKKVCVLAGVIISLVVTLNIQGHSNPMINLDEMTLLQIETLGLHESDTKKCSSIGTLDCPNQNSDKVKYIW